LAIRSQRNGKPQAAVGDRFIAPAYTKIPTKWGTEMRIRWNGYVYLIMLGYGRDESSPTPDGMFRGCFRNVRHTFRGRMLHY